MGTGCASRCRASSCPTRPTDAAGVGRDGRHAQKGKRPAGRRPCPGRSSAEVFLVVARAGARLAERVWQFGHGGRFQRAKRNVEIGLGVIGHVVRAGDVLRIHDNAHSILGRPVGRRVAQDLVVGRKLTPRSNPTERWPSDHRVNAEKTVPVPGSIAAGYRRHSVAYATNEGGVGLSQHP